MTHTFLLDLDDTLLGNDINTFLPAYTEAFGKFFASIAPPDVTVPNLLASTAKMVQNKRPDQTLLQVFENNFFPALGLKPEDLKDEIDDFYQEVFPTLRSLTNPRPAAKALVDECLQRGYRLAVATDPLFPRTATYQRLDWAGLSPQEYQFELISTVENFHFTKQSEAYYAECLACLGWPEGPVVMVGNDLNFDVLPARRLGLAAFWIHLDGERLPDSPYAPNGSGALEDILPWLDRTPEAALQPDFSQPAALLAILRATPAALSSLAAGLPNFAWIESPQAGEWSLTEILCHLRDVESEVNLPRLGKVIQEPNPFLPGMDTDPWAGERLYICQNGLDALHDFTGCRMDLLALLDYLNPADWERTARHAIFGPTHLSELVSIIAGHDRLHIRQAYQVLEAISASSIAN